MYIYNKIGCTSLFPSFSGKAGSRSGDEYIKNSLKMLDYLSYQVIINEKEKRKAGEAHMDGEGASPGTEPTTAVKITEKPTIHNRRFRE